jgi:hypothetical protein
MEQADAEAHPSMRGRHNQQSFRKARTMQALTRLKEKKKRHEKSAKKGIQSSGCSKTTTANKTIKGGVNEEGGTLFSFLRKSEYKQDIHSGRQTKGKHRSGVWNLFFSESFPPSCTFQPSAIFPSQFFFLVFSAEVWSVWLVLGLSSL